MTIFRYRSTHRGKSSDGLPGGRLAGRLIKRCSLYGCGLAILAELRNFSSASRVYHSGAPTEQPEATVVK